VISPPASRAQTDAIAADLHQYLHAPGGFLAMLAPSCRKLMAETQVVVPDTPTQAQLDSVHAGHDEHLLGLMTTPPKRVHVFANESIRLGVDPRDIVKEEIGHAMHFDHDLRPARIGILGGKRGMLCSGPHDMGGRPMGAAALEVIAHPPYDDPEYCPVCHPVRDLAHATWLLEYARETTWLTAQPQEVPIGIGGTIPLMRHDIACAQLDLTRANDKHMLGRQQGELRDACRLLDKAQMALVGILDRDQISAAFEPLAQARMACTVLTHSYFLHKHKGGLAVSDTQLLRVFRPTAV
jgi:hypothetical protein